MANVAFDAATSGTKTGTASSLTFAHTCTGSDRGLFVGVGAEQGGGITVTSVTYAAVGMTEKWNAIFSVFFTHGGFTLVAPSTGANNVVITMSGTCDTIMGGAISATNVHQTVPVGTADVGTFSAVTTTSRTVGSVGSEDLVVDSIFFATIADDCTAGANQTERYESGTTAGQSKTHGSSQAGADGGVMSWDSTFANFSGGHGAIAFKPVASAGYPVGGQSLGGRLVRPSLIGA